MFAAEESNKILSTNQTSTYDKSKEKISSENRPSFLQAKEIIY